MARRKTRKNVGRKGGRKGRKIKVDERTMVLKLIADASKELNKRNANVLEYAYAIRDNLFKADKIGEKEYKEIRDFLRRAKIQLLLNDREEDFRTLGRIEKDIMRIFEEKMR